MDLLGFDDCVDFEKNAYDSGYQSGIDAGKMLGEQEGFDLGLDTGIEYGLLFGKYQAWAKLWLAYYETHQSASSNRIKNNLVKLMSLIENAKIDNEFGTDIDKQVKLIEAKYKSLAANISSSPRHEKTADMTY